MSSQDQMRSINKQDYVIAVMGATGVGKSSFIRQVTGLEGSVVGHSLRSCTDRVQSFRCSHNGKNFVFLDTPGFDDTTMTDLQVLASIAEWLTTTYREGVYLAGVLYLQRISDNKITNTTLRNTHMFEMVCGKDALKNVMLVTTMWDVVNEEKGCSREDQLRDNFWKSMIDSGSRMARFLRTSDSAWEIVEKLDGVRRPLKLQIEMVDQGKDLSQTAAGNALFQWLTRVIEELRGLLKKLKTVLAVNKGNTIVAEDLRKDISRTEKKLRQAEQQQRGFGRSNRTFAEVVRGGDRSRSSSVGCGVIVSSPTGSVASSTSLQSVLESGRKWLAAKNLLGHGVAAAEIAPVPFLKGVVSLSLKIVESIEAMNRTERSLVVLARSARKFCIIIEQQKAIKNLSEDVRHALQDLVEELKEVQAVLQRMSSYGRTHRYILQQADEHVLSSCNQSIHDAYNLFMMRCVIAIHQDIQEWKQSQLATIRSVSPLRNATL